MAVLIWQIDGSLMCTSIDMYYQIDQLRIDLRIRPFIIEIIGWRRTV